MAAISFRSVSKRYGAASIIESLDLTIADGEFMVFVGPSGCGKSTALRMIAGLETVSGGDIAIGDRIVTDLAPKDRNVAMVFQSYALYPHMSVAENIAFGLKIRKVAPAEIDRLVKAAAEKLELAALLERKPKDLSGGQRQRVALGRAIVREPTAFLFDEPLSNLDAELRVSMRAEIARLQRDLGATMVYVTHDQVEAMTLGHRIAVLAPLARGGGRNLMQVGAPMDLYRKPANLFVARFIGSPPMSIFKGRFDEAGAIRFGAQALPAPSAFIPSMGEVSLGLRAEHVSDEARPGAAPIAGVVTAVERLGHETLVHMDVGAGQLSGRMSAARKPPTLGERFTLHAEVEAAHLFDPTTELRLPERSAS